MHKSIYLFLDECATMIYFDGEQSGPCHEDPPMNSTFTLCLSIRPDNDTRPTDNLRILAYGTKEYAFILGKINTKLSITNK